jgi:hypothetical protein
MLWPGLICGFVKRTTSMAVRILHGSPNKELMLTNKQLEVLDELTTEELEMVLAKRRANEHLNYKDKLIAVGSNLIDLLKHETPSCSGKYVWEVANASFGHGAELKLPRCTRCAMINILDNPDMLPFGVTLDIKFRLPNK